MESPLVKDEVRTIAVRVILLQMIHLFGGASAAVYALSFCAGVESFLNDTQPGMYGVASAGQLAHWLCGLLLPTPAILLPI